MTLREMIAGWKIEGRIIPDEARTCALMLATHRKLGHPHGADDL